MVCTYFFFIVSFLYGKLPDSRFDISTELCCPVHHLHLLGFLRGVGKVFLHTYLRSIDSTLHTAQAYPYLLVESVGVIVLIDGENLALFLFRKTEHRLYAVELGHILALVEQYLAVGVINNTFLDNGRLNDVVYLLRYDNGFSEIFSNRLIEILDVVCHVCRSKLPSTLPQ